MEIATNKKHPLKRLVMWMATIAIAATAGIAGVYHTSKTAQADGYNVENMQWGLLPAGEGSYFPSYSNMWTAAIDMRDWNPGRSQDETPKPFGASQATLTHPYVVGTNSPKTVSGDPDDWNSRSTAVVGDTIKQWNGETFKVTGFRLGASLDIMADADPDFNSENLRAEAVPFKFSVQEVTPTGQAVSSTNLKVAQVGTYQYSTILGFDKLANKDNLAKVTITPNLDNAQGQRFTGQQELYFSLNGDNTPVPSKHEWLFSYGTTHYSEGYWDANSMESNTAQNPIKITVPDKGKMYLDAIAADDADVYGKWSSDNSKLSFTAAENNMGEVVSGLDSLTPGTVIKFTSTLDDKNTKDFYFQFGDATHDAKEVPFNTSNQFVYQAGGYYDNTINFNPGVNWFVEGFGPSNLQNKDDWHGTVDKPIQVTLPKDADKFNYGLGVYDYDAGNASLPITVDSKYGLTIAANSAETNYKINGFQNLKSGTTVPFKLTYTNGDYSWIYVQFTSVPVPGDVEAAVNYVDDDANGKSVKTDTIKGQAGATGNYSVQAPANYDLAKGQAASVPYTLKPGSDTSDNLTVHLVHQKEAVTATTKTTIKYDGAGNLTPTSKVINVNWTGSKDKVTGQVSNWSTTNLPITVDTPTLNGYTADHSGVTIGQISGQTGTPADQTITVKYAAKSVTPNNKGGGVITVTPIVTNNNGSKGTTSGNTTGNTVSTTITQKTENNSTGLPNYAVVKGTAVYSTKKIYMYKHATFKKSQRIATYSKVKRVNRHMFVVIGYAHSNSGALRYKVRDVNHGKKTAGKVGYITANRKYVVNVYYKTMPKNNKITVISKTGVHAYKNKNLTGKAKTYKKGSHLKVKKIVKHNLTTRYQLSNGYYVTANKKLVIQGSF
ncbi:hypothetical protein FD17_GL001544 [Lentilactobacillus sunkii DSM 19904]|uniref:DUF5776 domain-containing protein n=1 Tax=Lentilactobacillus sunkii DSM 19904 TaxID=1423808 RepID=A0A0R1KTU9_9LACO|nr:DUF5776 domain-containing protein [Lentilactobacillus sunkii]KRK86959.1 hypothetical protein FD17_GL001544 [Lentilactobacillus sunkii DSM 19904]